MPDPVISVVLPVYNGARYIAIALQSLLAQKDVEIGDLEIIVCDDASRDDTVAIVRSFLQAGNIRLLVSEDNCGQFANFNRGLRLACGEYIQLFSHDDVARPGFLRSQSQILRHWQKVGLVYASCRIIDENGELTNVCDDEGTPARIEFPTYLKISSRHGALPPSISSVMFRRDVLSAVGLFDERFAVAGDLEFYNRVAERFEIARNRKLLLDVRSHRESCTSNITTPLKYMREEIHILPFYRRHLGAAAYEEMIHWRTRYRGADHAKHLLKLVFRGEFTKAREVYRALSQVHNVSQCVGFAFLDKARRLMKLRAIDREAASSHQIG
jgi:glycosyltransferase involved in cell wall biosynthesis